MKTTLIQKSVGSPRILYYHMVADTTPPFYTKTPINVSTFLSHIRYFKKRYKPVSLSEAIQNIQLGEPSEPSISLTFDDGFKECHTIIAPVLLKEGIPATFFLTNTCIDNATLMWRNKLAYIQGTVSSAHLRSIMHETCSNFPLEPPYYHENLMKWSERCWNMRDKDLIADFIWETAKCPREEEFLSQYTPYLSGEQIDDLLADGFSIGSHTHSHPDCRKLTYAELEYEIMDSMNDLSTRFHTCVDSCAYPFGLRSEDRMEAELSSHHPQLKSLLGNKSMNTNGADPLKWERDNMEFGMTQCLLRFYLLPLLRRARRL
jgi:peptidoglycan/xylan/chitin deacetylase (PgdA/CDA1 family)